MRRLGNGRSHLREIIRWSAVNKGVVVLEINIQVHSLDKLFLILSHHPIPEPERDIHLQMEISLINVNLLHKMAFLLAFPRFSWCCCFLKLISPKKSFGQTGIFWVCYIVLLLTCLCPYLLMNASMEGHPDIFKFLSIMNRAVLHYFMLVFISQFCKAVV